MSDVETTFDLMAFRQSLGSFATGVTVVATVDGEGNPRGFTANSFTSVSVDPPLILICVGRGAHSYGVFETCESFSVNILSEAQKEVSGLFASKQLDKFAAVPWRWSSLGCPVLADTLGSLECATHDRIVAGDHIILIGRVVHFSAGDMTPLVFYRGGYVSLGLAGRAVERFSGEAAVTGCIATWQDAVLLCRRDGDEDWTLPLSSLSETDQDAGGRARLASLLAAFGTDAALTFPYAVFENERDGAVYVIYRGALKGPPLRAEAAGVQCRLFTEKEIPWQAMRADLYHMMLKRYFREREAERFGIFSDVDEGTIVVP